MLELAEENLNKEGKNKKSHIGYYLIDKGINELYAKLEYTTRREETEQNKTKIYILAVSTLSILISIILSYFLNLKIQKIEISILSFILFLVPSSEVVIKVIQYILNKIVKPKIIPKIDFSNGIDKENSTIVVIPTIIKNKEKVQEMMKNLETYYLANKSENLYFTLLGDCSQSNLKEEKFDEEVIQEGIKQVDELNKKYPNDNFPIFSFIYRERKWNEKENSYLGWERKRGLLNQFNEYVLQQKNPFKINTLQEHIEKEETIKTLQNNKRNNRICHRQFN